MQAGFGGFWGGGASGGTRGPGDPPTSTLNPNKPVPVGDGAWSYPQSVTTYFIGFVRFERGIPDDPETTSPSSNDQQADYNACVKKAWRKFQKDYAKRGAKAAAGAATAALPVVLGFFSGAAEAVLHVGATVARPAAPAGIYLIKEAVGGPNAAAVRDGEVKDCLKQNPGASAGYFDFGIG